MNKKSFLALVAGTFMALSGMAWAEGTAVTQKYEVVCLKCMAHHAAMGDGGGHGEQHAKCAMKCSKDGTDLGLMDKDGNLFIPVDADFKSARKAIKKSAGQTIELSGMLIKTKGINYLQLVEKKNEEKKN
jgi:hypothetical protein